MVNRKKRPFFSHVKGPSATAAAIVLVTAILIAGCIGQQQVSNNNNDGDEMLAAKVVSTVQTSLIEWKERVLTAVEWSLFSDQAVNYYCKWQDALVAAAQDSGRAVKSCSLVTYYTLRPIVWLAYILSQGTLWVIYEIVLVRGIFSPTALNQMKQMLIKATDFQLSLTRKQLAIEAGLILSVLAVYQIVEVLKRRNYLRSVQLWVRGRTRAVEQVRTLLKTVVSFRYHRCVW